MLELQSHMHSWIYPSIEKYSSEQEDPLLWLCQRVVDLTFNPEDALMEEDYDSQVESLQADHADTKDKPIYWGDLIERLAKSALKYESTTNDGGEFYLDDWISIPWCDEDYYQEFYS